MGVVGRSAVSSLDTPEERPAAVSTGADVYREIAGTLAAPPTLPRPFGRTPADFYFGLMSSRYQVRARVLFAMCAGLFVLHQVGQKIVGISLPLIDSYLDPLLCMPILLQLITWERQLFHRSNTYILPRSHIFGYFLLISIVCEWVLPRWNPKLISDPWDVLAYALGTVMYVLVATPYRRPASEF